jgi:hypothetical protein
MSAFMMAARVRLRSARQGAAGAAPGFAKRGKAVKQTDLAGEDLEIHIPDRTGEPPFGELMELDFRPRGFKKLSCSRSEILPGLPAVGIRLRRHQLLACAANI